MAQEPYHRPSSHAGCRRHDPRSRECPPEKGGGRRRSMAAGADIKSQSTHAFCIASFRFAYITIVLCLLDPFPPSIPSIPDPSALYTPHSASSGIVVETYVNLPTFNKHHQLPAIPRISAVEPRRPAPITTSPHALDPPCPPTTAASRSAEAAPATTTTTRATPRPCTASAPPPASP